MRSLDQGTYLAYFHGPPSSCRVYLKLVTNRKYHAASFPSATPNELKQGLAHAPKGFVSVQSGASHLPKSCETSQSPCSLGPSSQVRHTREEEEVGSEGNYHLDSFTIIYCFLRFSHVNVISQLVYIAQVDVLGSHSTGVLYSTGILIPDSVIIGHIEGSSLAWPFYILALPTPDHPLLDAHPINPDLSRQVVFLAGSILVSCLAPLSQRLQAKALLVLFDVDTRTSSPLALFELPSHII